MKDVSNNLVDLCLPVDQCKHLNLKGSNYMVYSSATNHVLVPEVLYFWVVRPSVFPSIRYFSCYRDYIKQVILMKPGMWMYDSVKIT